MLSWRTNAIFGTIGGISLARVKPAVAVSPFRRSQSSQAVEAPAPPPVKSRTIGRRQLPLWRAKRRAYERVSPSAVILQRLDARGGRMTREQWDMFQEIARSRSTRLPVMTAQMLLRQEEATLRTSLSQRLTDEDDPEDWGKRLAILAHTGITEEHLRHWVWILQGRTADERVERFLSADTHKPVFLLFIVTAKGHTILDRQLFVSLLDYVDKTYCRHKSQAAAEQQPMQRTLDSHLGMTPVHFVTLLARLVSQALRLGPEALVTIAELTIAYLKAIPTFVSAHSHDSGYTQQCLLFNHALCTFSRTSYLRPFANIRYNWEAQKHLLAFSTSLKRPLIINQAGYRAIQTVMVGREKSEDEVKVALRSAKSWPPYREAWDGLDEQRHPEDDLSRAVKTGVLAREAGYPDSEVDRALATVGGAVLGEGPTVQTRSRAPVVGPGRSSGYVYAAWVANVRATRNAQEAWAQFRRPPLDGLRPAAPVYAEMFAKLLASEVADPESAVPGSSKENMPVYQPGNLSEFEKWRLQPPTVAELYEDMLRRGMKPVGQVLGQLVLNSESEEEVLRYMHDSPYRAFAKAVQDRDASCPPSQAEFFRVDKVYRSVPLTVFGAYISFLCKMQRKIYAAPHNLPEDAPAGANNGYLQRALAVASVRLRPETAEGRTYKPPWYHILRTMVLARTHMALVTVASRQMGLFLDVFKWVCTHTGMDTVLMDIMCLSVGRVMASNFTNPHPGGVPDREGRWWVKADHVAGAEQRKLLARAWVDVMVAFEEMKKPASGMTGFHIYTYIRVLGMYGAVDDMIVVTRWVLTRLEEGAAFQGGNEDGTASHGYLLRAFGFMDAYGRECGRGDEVASVEARRRLLVEEGYPFALGEMSDHDREDVRFVKAIAEGWERHVADGDMD